MIHNPFFRNIVIFYVNLSNDVDSTSKWATISSQTLGIKLNDSLSSTIYSSYWNWDNFIFSLPILETTYFWMHSAFQV